ncbi:MAG: hypothetical protein KF704_07785 [Crocinitomicaceae bacterium]|nr:hypothetical protein [Crocinitomicaceae bacterium]NGF75904.1 hypothetical protein [Fluviicola sp. SGL-29]
MKKLLFTVLLCPLFSFSQDGVDYKLARTGEYVLGVYIFVHSDPIAPYDFVGKIDKFDISKTDTKEVEKIIKKAKKKNSDFDGMIIKKDYKHIELIKFGGRATSYAGFALGDKVQYESFGRLIQGEIVDFLPHRQRATIKYTDPEGNEKLDGVAIKSLNKIPETATE